MDSKTFKDKIGLLIRVFPEKEMDVEIMWEFLKDLSNDEFSRAVSMVIIKAENVNKATNMIALIRKYSKDDGYLAEQAWTDVLNAAREIGFYGKPVFKNEATRKATECITWGTICHKEDLSYERAVFIKAYNNFHEQCNNEESLKAIEGPVKDMIGDLIKKIGVSHA